MPGQPTACRLAGREGWRTPCERQQRRPLAALWPGQLKRPARRAWPQAYSAVISLATGPPVPATPAAGPALQLAGSERVMALCLSLDTDGDFPRSGRGPHAAQPWAMVPSGKPRGAFAEILMGQ